MYIGIDIGGTKCAIVKGRKKENGEMEILEKIRFETLDVSTTLEKIFDAVEALMPCDKIGISCGGPLDEARGVILSPPNLPGWDEVHITEMLEERFKVPARLCNDANACALAEWKFGAGKGSENMVFMTFGTGLGAGLILNGRLYSGTNGMAGEAGHIRLEKGGPVGYGKAGSFEGFCSGAGIAKLAKEYAKTALTGGSVAFSCRNEDEIEKITAKMIADLAKSGDEDALKIFNESAKRLGMGLSVIIDILNPERIVLGGIYTRCEELFKDGMSEVLSREALLPSLEACKILPAVLGESIGDISALAVADL